MSTPTAIPDPAITPHPDAGYHPGPRADQHTDTTADVLPTDEPGLLVLANRRLQECEAIDAERGANTAAERIQVESLKARYTELDGPLVRRREGLVRELEAIYAALPHRGSKKSRTLAFGTLGTRTVPERLDVVDEAALRNDAHGWEPDLMEHVFREVPRKLDHRALVALVKSKGALPAGVTVVPAREEFYVRPQGGPDPRD